MNQRDSDEKMRWNERMGRVILHEINFGYVTFAPEKTTNDKQPLRKSLISMCARIVAIAFAEIR